MPPEAATLMPADQNFYLVNEKNSYLCFHTWSPVSFAGSATVEVLISSTLGSGSFGFHFESLSFS